MQGKRRTVSSILLLLAFGFANLALGLWEQTKVPPPGAYEPTRRAAPVRTRELLAVPPAQRDEEWFHRMERQADKLAAAVAAFREETRLIMRPLIGRPSLGKRGSGPTEAPADIEPDALHPVICAARSTGDFSRVDDLADAWADQAETMALVLDRRRSALRGRNLFARGALIGLTLTAAGAAAVLRLRRPRSRAV